MTRYFEDVKVGDELAPIERIPSEDQAIDFFGRDNPTNPAFGDAEAGRKQGFGGALVPGLLKMSWLVAFVTEWAGKEAFVIKVRAAYRRADVAGRPLTLAGTVVEKREEDGLKIVEIEAVTLASGEPSVRGNVTVSLPSRADAGIEA